MRQGFVRALALGALTVVACAPIASAGAAGGAPSPGVGAAAPAPHPTWAQVARQLHDKAEAQRARDRAAHSGTDGAASASAPGGSTGSGTRAGALSAATAVTPTLTVTPATGLVAGQGVSVTGSGFAAGEYILGECAAGGSDPGTCDLSGVSVAIVGSSGTFSTGTTVRRTLRLDPTPLDCASHAGACEMVVVDFATGSNVLARAALTFDSSAPLPHPTITVTPSTGLLAGQQVTVAGSGFVAGDQLTLSQCASSDPACFEQVGGAGVVVGADGRFSVPLTVHLRINDLMGDLTTCIAVGCFVQAGSYVNPDYVATAPITFDPNQPVPPPPSITVTPHTGLHHDQQVDVRGANFDPNSQVSVSECGTDQTGFCGEYLADLQADASGAFTASVAVSRLVREYTFPLPGDPITSSIVDCAPAACEVAAYGYGENDPISLHASASIAFDTSVPPPPLPVVTVTPRTNLPYRTTVAVHGTGFTPGEQINSEFCASDRSGSSCGGAGGGFGTADAHGVVDLTVPVTRRIGFVGNGGAVIDCADVGARCYIEVYGQRSYEQTDVDLTFDPNTQIPPPPTATVTPDHGLGYHASVTVNGSGFVPGSVFASQCAPSTDEPLFPVCFAGQQFAVDASGHISGTMGVDRVLSYGPGGPGFDCATAASPCFLQIGDGSVDGTVNVPLGFDPNSQPPPPPVLTVTPSRGLFDGQHVTVAGRNYVPGSQVGVTECRAGVTAIADGCDLSQVRVATVGADGTFSRRFVTESVLRTSDGPIDCTVRADACVLTAANAPLRTDFAAAPLSFDAPELSVLGVGVTEGTGGMTMAPVQVRLSKPDRNPITVHWVADAETASPGTDYTSMRGTLTVPAGATEAMIDAEVVADASDEPTETFRIRVVDALGTKVVDSTGVVTIHDDDAAPAVSIRDTSRREDHGEAHAEVVLAAPSGHTVIVHYVTHHGTARAGTDYVRKDSRLVFLPGETRHLVRVVLVNDRVHEPTETFRVEIDRAEQARIGRGTATVTITDDD